MSDWNKLWRGFRKVRNDVSRDVRKLKFSDVLEVIPTLALPEAEGLLGKVQARILELGGTLTGTVTASDTQFAWGIEREKEGEAANGHEPNH